MSEPYISPAMAALRIWAGPQPKPTGHRFIRSRWGDPDRCAKCRKPYGDHKSD